MLKPLILALLLLIGMEVSSEGLARSTDSVSVVRNSAERRDGSQARLGSALGLLGPQYRSVAGSLRQLGATEEALTQAQEIEEVGDGLTDSVRARDGGGVLAYLDYRGADSPPLGDSGEESRIVDLEALVRESIWRWFLEEEIDYVLCLSWNESRYDRLALSATGDRGVLQINPYWNRYVLADMGYNPDDLWDIDRNVQVAAEIRNRWNGFGAWSTRYLCGG